MTAKKCRFLLCNKQKKTNKQQQQKKRTETLAPLACRLISTDLFAVNSGAEEREFRFKTPTVHGAEGKRGE